MFENFGILFALIALFGWAFGDFFIQKSTRVMGWYKTLFLIGAAGFVLLAPFALLSLPDTDALVPLVLVSFIILIYAWAIFEALRVGKISVVESVVAIELPLTVGLAIFFGKDSLTLLQGILFLIICAGIFLAATKDTNLFKHRKHWLEKGVLLACIGAFFSALTNFYVGEFSQTMSPLIVIFITHSMLGLICAVYISLRLEWKQFAKEIVQHRGTALGTATFDNAAWLGYAYATSMIPTSLVVTMTESYIALAACLGWIFGHERLKRHQVIGAVIAFIGAGIFATTI